MSVLFSVLMLSVPNRVVSPMMTLYNKVLSQIGDRKDIELLCLLDNKSMSIGEKRNKLLSCARGKYLAFLDDDDDVADTYIKDIMFAIESAPNHGMDVITFKQHCTVNGKQFLVDFDLSNQNQPAILDAQGNYPDITRKPYHMCVWRSMIAKNTQFPDISYGEDLAWLSKLWITCKSQYKLDKVLHYYQYSDQTSESIKRK